MGIQVAYAKAVMEPHEGIAIDETIRVMVSVKIAKIYSSSPVDIIFMPIVFISGKRGNTITLIVLASREGWDNVTRSKNVSWIHETECVWIFQR